MKITLFLAAALFPLIAFFNGGCSRNTALDFPKYGFEIQPLDSAPAEVTAQVMMMFLPPDTEGFAPSVNVQIQPFKEKLEKYITISKDQIGQMRGALISESKVNDKEWTIEYTGSMNAMTMHCYARVMLSKDKAYLISGTARDIDWDKSAEQIKKSVNSFKLKSM